MITGDNITDEQIRRLLKQSAGKGGINAGRREECRLALGTREARTMLDNACVHAVMVNPDGSEIEHRNHNVLTAAHELGRALIARTRCAEILDARKVLP